MLLELAFLFLDGDAGPVTNKLVGTGQRIEQRCFTATVAADDEHSLAFSDMYINIFEKLFVVKRLGKIFTD